MAVATALVVFAGFAPTYYLKAVYGTPSLSPLLHLHGAVFTAWFVLYGLQTALIATRRTALHRRLGMAGAVLAVGMVILGTVVAIAAARRPAVAEQPLPLEFLVVPLGDLVVFATLVALAVYNRRHREAHKRLMLLATISILSAGFGRLLAPGGALAFVGFSQPMLVILTAVFLAACLAYDHIVRGRIHAAFAWGSAFIISVYVGRIALASTSAWLTVARWLTS